MRVSVVSDDSSFAALREDWNALLERSSTDIPFLRHEWFWLWWQHFGEGRQLWIVVVYDGKTPCLIMPLMREAARPLRPVRVLRSMTNSHAYRWHYLCEPTRPEAIEAALSYLAVSGEWDLMDLDLVAGTATERQALLDLARKRGHAVTRAVELSPVVEVTGSWEAFHSSLKKRFRSRLRRSRKSLEAGGKVSFELVSGGEQLQAKLDEGFAVERQSWKGRSGTAIACHPNLVAFYSAWAHTAAAKGWLRLFFLRLEDNAVAFDFSLLHRGQLYTMKAGYDEAYKQASVGHLLNFEVLRRVFEGELGQAVHRYHFMGKDEPYKREWAKDSYPEEIWQLYHRSARAVAYHTMREVVIPSLKNRLRPVVKQLKPYLRPTPR